MSAGGWVLVVLVVFGCWCCCCWWLGSGALVLVVVCLVVGVLVLVPGSGDASDVAGGWVMVLWCWWLVA